MTPEQALAGLAADAITLRPLLDAVLAAQARLQAAEQAVADVADVLRRDQKFAPPGRPSLHLVQLRRQQAGVKQAALVARRELAQAAQAFVHAAKLPLKPDQPPSAAVLAWLRRHQLG